MLMAVIDQSLGDSTLRCSKMLLPFASVMLAVRSSHSTSSYGETPVRVKYLGNFSPGAACPACPEAGCCVCVFVFSFMTFAPVSAISFSPIRFDVRDVAWHWFARGRSVAPLFVLESCW